MQLDGMIRNGPTKKSADARIIIVRDTDENRYKKKTSHEFFSNLSLNGKLGKQRDANGAAQEHSFVEIN